MLRTIFFIAALAVFFACNNKLAKKEAGKPVFEKIIFHTSPCFGLCPTYHLEVNADKAAKLYAETVYNTQKGFSRETDPEKTGYFKGVVNDSLFTALNKELTTVGLDSLTFDESACCDGSIYTIIVYYDGKRKFLRSMFPPQKANPLIGILNRICAAGEYKRTSKEFEIENKPFDN